MMKPQSRNEGGFVLLMTLMFTLLAAIAAAAFLHVSKTQVFQSKLNSHSMKAFYAAEVGLAKATKLLKDDFYYTPEGIEPSWADDKVYSATGYIKLLIQKYMNPLNPHYDEDFYPLVAETNYVLEASGRYKATYAIGLSNVPGWTDRIWVKATGRYYRSVPGTTGYVLEAERRILALLRAREISPWNNAIFAGEGASGRVINGNVDIRGSVHLLGTSLGSNDLAAEFSGSGNVKNNYEGMPADLASRVPSIQKSYGSEILDSLEAEVRVQHGKVALSGSSVLGEANQEGNGVKETVEGVYITDGYGGNSGEINVHSDNGTKNPYDLEEFDIKFPRMSDPYGGYATYMDYLKTKALVISDPAALAQLALVVPSSSFSYSNEHGKIAMDGAGHLTIQGIVVVEGDVDFEKEGSDKTIQYTGKGLIASTTHVEFNCNMLTMSMSTYPATDLLGAMSAGTMSFGSSQVNVMGVFYAEDAITSKKQTNVAGTFFSNYFDMGLNVPAIYQVPDVVHNLPDGMIGDFRVWTVNKVTWGEI